MRLTDRKITIIGAGIGGLAAALAFSRQGAKVTVLEQAEAITEVGAGLQISPNGVAVLRALGLADDLAWSAPRARAVVLRSHRRGREVLRLDLDQYAPGQNFYFAHRADLINLLADAARQAGVKVRLLQKVDRITSGARPVVHLANGAQCSGDLVIGADGLHSKARAALNGIATPRFTGQVAWRATVANLHNHPAEAQVFMGPGRHLVTYPLRDSSLMNIVAVQERKTWAEEGWHHRDDPEALRSAFTGFGGAAADLLAQVDQVALWGLFRHPVAEVWHQGSLAIMGDAAHPTLPFMAQGANLALEDAWVLVDALRTASSDEEGLAAYQQRRRSRAAKVVDAATGNAWKYHLRQPLAWPAHQILRLGGRLAPQRMVQQFDWIYGHDVTGGTPAPTGNDPGAGGPITTLA
ncbi:FAD-dependent monooxygenase [Phaeobacter inhibens]|uniref:FAD-dependent monooxygenase n=1 Tax=Phaeobacter inhibens TaxID=221822 RepID=UPI000C9A9581|nr:FAD-dependent monooxygenase [Phaeobacter inhibens]AUQ62062.1 FAD dependent oxidoreductase [Phaeobacter inhibens]AUQ82036.1 FAD dependent oxidoreductase [Phaeobacter inhibens]AUQ89759.1 FAD dependent oxidoreductase [Phaeobacter inhibens]MDO6755479.1 FAD-dependent monooxygenase [Phaeobacter inhibens]UWR77446.1 FAD-dependent monooxygenase [Phaeobacter inhibens]